MTADWSAIEALPATKLTDLFAADPDRLAKLSLDVAGIHFDWSKTHLTDGRDRRVRGAGQGAGPGGQARGAVRGRGRQRHRGPRGRAHRRARRGQARERRDARRRCHARMRALIDAIEADALGPIRHILHVGIGGSALGPRPAGRRARPRRRRATTSRSSPTSTASRWRTRSRFDPAATLLVVASQDLHHHRDDAQRRKRAAVDDRARRRGSLWPRDRADRVARQGDRMGRRRDPHPAVRRERRRALFAVVVDRLSRRRSRSAGTRSRNCSKARPRWTGISG